MSPPILHTCIRAIVGFEVLTQPVGIAHVVCDVQLARALVIGAAADGVVGSVRVAGLVGDVGDLSAVARVADAFAGRHGDFEGKKGSKVGEVGADGVGPGFGWLRRMSACFDTLGAIEYACDTSWTSWQIPCRSDSTRRLESLVGVPLRLRA